MYHLFLFACLSLLAFNEAAVAEVVVPRSTDFCYAVGGSTSPDTVVRIDRVSGAESIVGSAGVDGIQALAFPPSGTVPFAASADRLGTINTETGAFTAVGSAFGTTVNPTAIALNNVVGLAWSSLKDQPAVLYAVHRRSPEDDILFVIDVRTGLYVPNAFGPNIDYVTISGGDLECQPDIEGIAFDPVTMLMYGVSNDNGMNDALVTIQPLDGDCEGIDNLTEAALGRQIDSMGGLTFSVPYGDPNSGSKNAWLYGTSGDSSDPNTENRFWLIDPGSAIATEVSALTAAADYRAVACPTRSCDQLKLSMSHLGTAIAGSTITFKIFWTNVCMGQDFPSVVITSTLPSGMEVISATSGAAAVAIAGNTVTLNAGTVRSNQVAGLAKVKARLVAQGGALVNKAILTDGFGGQVSAIDTVQVHASKTRLTLKLRGQTTTRPGRRVSYVAHYRNAAEANQLTMTLPAELGTPTTVFPSSAAVAGSVLAWQHLPAPTGMVKIGATVSPGVAVPSVLTVTASMSDGTGAADTHSQDTLVDSAVAKKVPLVPSLSITAPTTVTPGLVTQLTARYRNISGDATLQVNLPPQLAAVELTIPQASSDTGGVVTWNKLPVPTGSIKIKTRVSSSAVVGSDLVVTGTLVDANGFTSEASDKTTVR